MKAPKISFDSAKLQQMLMLHVEKLVLGVVLLAVIWFVYQGASLPMLEDSKTPDQLTQKAQQMTTEIGNANHWQVIYPDRKPLAEHPVQALVKQGQQANASTAYPISNGWNPPNFAKAISRPDPRLFAPTNVKVVVLHGPLAVLPRQTDVDPILAKAAEVNPAVGAEGQQPGVIRPQPAQPARPGQQRPPTTRPKRGGLLEGGPQAGYGEGIAPPMMMQPGGAPGQAGARVLPPEAIVGYHGGAEIIAREARAAVIMAAVPLEKQFEEYEKAFKEALDYDPTRDLPRYILYVVERADVTDNPALDPAQATWQALDLPKALGEMNLWGPSPREVVDPSALDPILTNRIPPFMQREIYEALIHPDIPLAKVEVADPNAAQAARPGDIAAANAAGNSVDLLDPNAAPIAANPNQPGGEGMVRPGQAMPGPRGYPAMMPPGGARGYGEGMQGSPGAQASLAKFRLLRFTDTTLQPFRKYRYRVKLLLEDPNNPYAGPTAPRWDPSRNTPLRKPSIQSMSQAALARVRRADTAKYPFLLETEPSEPSDIVELPQINRYFAGKATAGNGNPLAIGTPGNSTLTPPIYSTQSSTNLLTVEFDNKLAVDIPAEKEVYRGSTLNFEKEVDVIHPSLLAITPIGKYAFRNGSMVIDFVGGNDIPNLDARRSDKVQEPSEVLIFDELGNLQILDETDDVEGFRRYLPPKPEEPKATTTQPLGPEGYPGGILEGPPGPRSRRPGKG